MYVYINTGKSSDHNTKLLFLRTLLAMLSGNKNFYVSWYKLLIGRICEFHTEKSRWYCATGLFVSVLLYFLVLSLTWSFAKGLPIEVHGPSDASYVAGVAVSLPAAMVTIAACFIFITDRKGCADRGFVCAAISWGVAFFFSGVSSLVGALCLFISAGSPPASDLFNPQAYIAFAAIAGIMATIAGITYCFTAFGFPSKRFDGKNFVWPNEDFHPFPTIFEFDDESTE